MQLITHQTHVDKLLESNLKAHIQVRYDQLSEDTDVPPNIVLVEDGDDITGPDYAFVGPEDYCRIYFKSTNLDTSNSPDPTNSPVICGH
jgi:hypothetical protein